MTATIPPQPRAFIGVDLGQRRNHSAFAVIELHWDAAEPFLLVPRLVLRYLRRVPLFTDYIDVHNDIVTLATDSSLPVDVVVDAAGPGGPMVDWLRRSLPPGVGLHPVIITGGRPVFRPSPGRNVHRRVLLTGLVSLFRRRRIAVPEGLPFFDEFVEEAAGLRTNLLPAHGCHDDMVIAASLASNAVRRHIAAVRRAERGSK